MTDRQPAEYGKVAVVHGGLGAEREVSLASGTRVLAALRDSGVDAHGVDAGRDLVARLERGGFDRVFNILHGTGGEDGALQGVLEWLGMPYTGSGVLGSALSMDKLRSKHLWRSLGMPVPDDLVLRDAEDCGRAVDALGLPLIVKPAHEGSSVGMTKVVDAGDMAAAFELARASDGTVFAERWLPGAEYTVSVLGGAALPAIRIETPRVFYDYAAKYTEDTTRYLIPCGLDPEAESAMAGLAVEAFAAIGGSGWGRVDFMCDAHGAPWLIEANTVPGMTDHSLVPMAAAANGIDFGALCLRILDTSFNARAGKWS
jgi:D-alanine-D-alanine ligase